MPIEAKEILEFLGFDPAKISDMDTFKKTFEPEAGKPLFIRADSVDKSHVYGSIVGKLRGSIETKAKAIAKKFGIEFQPDEIKDKAVEDIIELAFDKQAQINKSIVDDLTAKAGHGNDEKVKDWEKKYGALEIKHKEISGLLEATSNDFNKFKEDAIKASEMRKINDFKKETFGKLKFRQNASELEKTGFLSKIAEKYEFAIDETEGGIVKDKATNERIKSTKVTGKFKSPDEVLEEELIAFALNEKNPAGGKPVGPFKQPEQQQQYQHSSSLRGNNLHPSRQGASA